MVVGEREGERERERERKGGRERYYVESHLQSQSACAGKAGK